MSKPADSLLVSIFALRRDFLPDALIMGFFDIF